MPTLVTKRYIAKDGGYETSTHINQHELDELRDNILRDYHNLAYLDSKQCPTHAPRVQMSDTTIILHYPNGGWTRYDTIPPR